MSHSHTLSIWHNERLNWKVRWKVKRNVLLFPKEYIIFEVWLRFIYESLETISILSLCVLAIFVEI